MFFICRQLHSKAKGASPGDNGYFVDGIGAGQQHGYQCVTCLVIGGDLFFLFGDDHAAALGPHHNFVLGLFHMDHGDLVRIGSGGKQCGLVYHIFQISSGKTGGATGYYLPFYIIRESFFLTVYLKDLLPTLHVWHRHYHLSVKTAWPEQGRVKHIGTVGGRDDDYSFIGFKTIHLYQ